MTKSQHAVRAGLAALWLVAIAGALSISYPHQADLIQTLLAPADYGAWVGYVGALAFDAMVVAAAGSLAVMPVGAPGREWPLAAMVIAVGASVAANLRWVAVNTPTPEGAGAWLGLIVDAVVGGALLPILALVGSHALVWTLKAGRAVDAPPVPAHPVTASEPRKAAPATKAKPAPKRGTRKATGAVTGQEPEWYARARTLAAEGMRPVDIAAEVERSQTRVSRVLNGAAVNGAGGGA